MNFHRGNIASRATVTGAGIGGLAAALVLADHFEEVLIFERDLILDGMTSRPGTPQASHAHALLAGGREAFRQIAPELEADLLSLGAQVICQSTDLRWDRPGFDPFPQRDLGISTLTMSRGLFETALRKRVLANHNIILKPGCLTVNLEADNGNVTRIRCNSNTSGDEIYLTDFHIDASGHGELANRLFRRLGIPLPEDEVVTLEASYSSAFFEIPSDAPTTFRAAITHPDNSVNRRSGFLFPVEGSSWIVSLGGRYDTVPPLDEGGFRQHAAELRTSTISNAIRSARMCSPIKRYSFRANRWRHFERMKSIPGRLLPIGDSICRFNPYYGQGMSVTAKEAVLLRELLCEVKNKEELSTLTHTFLSRAHAIVSVAWSLSVLPDLADPKTGGVRPKNLEERLSKMRTRFVEAAKDGIAHRQLVQFLQLVESPT